MTDSRIIYAPNMQDILFEPIFPGANITHAVSACCHEPVEMIAEENNSSKKYARCKRCKTPLQDAIGDKPVVFLAGPIQGATTWQYEAAEILTAGNPDVIVASPRREYPITGRLTDVDYQAQVDWETWFLRRAGENGCVLFWMPLEDHHIPGRSYAQTTRFELGEWKERAMRRECNLVVGIEDEFPNKRYIVNRFAQDCSHIPIVKSLQAVCAHALIVLTVLAEQEAASDQRF